jgi:excisionase family DNA binding protein
MNKNTSKNEGASLPKTNAASFEQFTLATAPELARICKVSRRTVDNWTKTRRIPFLKIGGAVRFNVPEVMAALSRFTVDPFTIR